MPERTKLYVIRHGEAKGNQPNDPLTPRGNVQAEQLADFLLQREESNIVQLISSPYLRAKQTAEVLDTHLNAVFSTDDKLREIDFGDVTEGLDLQEQVRKQFEDFNSKLQGGESNQEVMDRVDDFLKDKLLQNHGDTLILVTHSVAMTLLLRHFDEEKFGFNQWKELTNPDVYVVTLANNNTHIEDIWITD